MKKPKVSVVIPAYNEEGVISECIKTLLSQTYKNIEIIIVDDGSTDKTRSIVKKFKKVKLIEGEHKGPGFSRNLGSKIAKGTILVFVDADMYFDKNYIFYLIKPILKGEGIGSEERIQIASNPDNIWSKCWGQYTKDLRKNADKGYIFRAILKSEFLKMKGFDPSYGYADDLSLYYKYGVRSIFADKSICYHKNPETLKEVYKQSRWIMASKKSFIISAPITKYFVPFFALIALPFLVPILSIRKCIRNKNLFLIMPMLVFMTIRYLGSISGLIKKIYFNRNVR